MTSTRQMTGRALTVGFLGYASVVVFYAIVDVSAGRGILYTGNVLGKAFFRRLLDPQILAQPIPIDLEAILWHNVMHLCVAMTIGFIVIGLVEDAIRNPAKSGFILFTFFLGFVVTIAAMRFITAPIAPLIPLWTIVLTNAVAAAFAGSIILRWYPDLWEALSTSKSQLEAQPESATSDRK